MTEVTLSLPDELARKALSAGLLEPDAIEQLVREAVKRHEVDQVFASMGSLAQLAPALTEADIDAEIAAARADRVRRR